MFQQFWSAYPKRNGRRVGKQQAITAFHKLSEPDRELSVRAATNYAGSQQAHDGFAKDAERFLKADFWRDWLEPATEENLRSSDTKQSREALGNQIALGDSA